MTFSYRDPTLLASTLAPLVDLAAKVVQLQYKLDPESALHATLKAAEGRIAKSIGECLDVEAHLLDPAEDDAVRTIKVGDCVRIARKTDTAGWCSEMDQTVGLTGQVVAIDPVVLDDIPIQVEPDSGDRWYYPPSVLELVTSRTSIDVPK